MFGIPRLPPYCQACLYRMWRSYPPHHIHHHTTHTIATLIYMVFSVWDYTKSTIETRRNDAAPSTSVLFLRYVYVGDATRCCWWCSHVRNANILYIYFLFCASTQTNTYKSLLSRRATVTYFTIIMFQRLINQILLNVYVFLYGFCEECAWFGAQSPCLCV